MKDVGGQVLDSLRSLGMTGEREAVGYSVGSWDSGFLFGVGRVAMEGPRVLGREAVRPVPVPVGVDCLHRTAPSF